MPTKGQRAVKEGKNTDHNSLNFVTAGIYPSIK